MSSSDEATEKLLKSETGEFSLESIFFLDFSGKGLFSLGCIPKCTNLYKLDLSCNHLSGIGELPRLTHLEHLNLNDNNITSLGGLEKIESLRRLEVAGNNISSFDSLLPLAHLVNFNFLSLQIVLYSATPPLHLSNPICQDSDYSKLMLEYLPNLQWLDGEELLGKGSQFYKEVNAIKTTSSLVETTEYSRNVDTQHHTTHFALPEPPDDEGDDMISELLASCQESSSKVQQQLNLIKTELNLPQ